MEDLSLHILDVVENSIQAGATLIGIKIHDDPEYNLLRITVEDNGSGMNKDMLSRVCDPFVTTRTTRRVGLGLSLFRQAALDAGGDLSVKSEPGRGTEVKVFLKRDHIDRKPMGDIGATLLTLIAGNPEIDFVFESNHGGVAVELDTREIRKELDGEIPINSAPVLNLIRELLSR